MSNKLYLSSLKNADFLEGVRNNIDKLLYLQRDTQKGFFAIVAFVSIVIVFSMPINNTNIGLTLSYMKSFIYVVSGLVCAGYEVRIINRLWKTNKALTKIERDGVLVYGKIIWSRTKQEVRPPWHITYFKYIFTIPDSENIELQDAAYCILERHSKSIPTPEIGTTVVIYYLDKKSYILL